jgi:hypothetical protein
MLLKVKPFDPEQTPNSESQGMNYFQVSCYIDRVTNKGEMKPLTQKNFLTFHGSLMSASVRLFQLGGQQSIAISSTAARFGDRSLRLFS